MGTASAVDLGFVRYFCDANRYILVSFDFDLVAHNSRGQLLQGPI